MLTGAHIGDYPYAIAGSVQAIAIDTPNRCRWIVVQTAPAEFELRRCYFPGSANPAFYGIHKIDLRMRLEPWIRGLTVHLRHMIASQIIPALFRPVETAQFLDLVKFAQQIAGIKKPNEIQIILLRDLIVLISLNTKTILPTEIQLINFPRDLFSQLSATLKVVLLFSAPDLFGLGYEEFRVLLDDLSKQQGAPVLATTMNLAQVLGWNVDIRNIDLRSASLRLLFQHQRVLTLRAEQYLREHSDVTFDRLF
jgi:hypothetical protein